MNKSTVLLSSLLLVMGSEGLAAASKTVKTPRPINKISQLNLASRYRSEAGVVNESASYSPYVELSGSKFFNVGGSAWSTGLDLFIPILQANLSNLFFTHIRLFDRSGRQFEGNVHVGYRHLTDDHKIMYGIYGAFDRARALTGDYFNQLTFGAECWINNFFVGCNGYFPIGTQRRTIREYLQGNTMEQDKQGHIVATRNGDVVAAYRGFDYLFGYEIIPGFSAFAGGYYFTARDSRSLCGPKAKMVYNFDLGNRRILGVFDKVGLEVGVKNDWRGTMGYASANLRIGLSRTKVQLPGNARHMVDLVQRDEDIVSGTIENIPVVLEQFSKEEFAKNFTVIDDDPSGDTITVKNVTTGLTYQIKRVIYDRVVAKNVKELTELVFAVAQLVQPVQQEKVQEEFKEETPWEVCQRVFDDKNSEVNRERYGDALFAKIKESCQILKNLINEQTEWKDIMKLMGYGNLEEKPVACRCPELNWGCDNNKVVTKNFDTGADIVRDIDNNECIRSVEHAVAAALVYAAHRPSNYKEIQNELAAGEWCTARERYMVNRRAPGIGAFAIAFGIANGLDPVAIQLKPIFNEWSTGWCRAVVNDCRWDSPKGVQDARAVKRTDCEQFARWFNDVVINKK